MTERGNNGKDMEDIAVQKRPEASALRADLASPLAPKIHTPSHTVNQGMPMKEKEYLQLIQRAPVASFEYLCGVATPAAPQSIETQRLGANAYVQLFAALSTATRSQKRRGLGRILSVRKAPFQGLIRGVGGQVIIGTLVDNAEGYAYCYPDCTISIDARDRKCGNPIRFPSLVVEVVSPPHDAWKVKLRFYEAFSTVQEVVLIDSMSQRVEVHSRDKAGGARAWTRIIYERGEHLVLKSLNIDDIPVDRIFSGVNVEK